MKVLLDKNGFIQSYALIGDLVDGIDIPTRKTSTILPNTTQHTK